MLNVRLQTLLAVADEKSASKAALRLNLTQPAVSQHLRALETELGCKLFRRTDHGMRLTEEGEIVLYYAKRFVSMYDTLQKHLLGFKNGKRFLTVGISKTAEVATLTEMLAHFCELHQKLSIKIVTEDATTLFKDLNEFKIDLAIADSKAQNADLNSLCLLSDKLVCVASKQNPISVKRLVSLSDLRKQKLILHGKSNTVRQIFEDYLKSKNDHIDSFNLTLELDDTATIKHLVTQNVGVSILPLSVCQSELRKDLLVSLPVENMNLCRDLIASFPAETQNIDLIDELANYFSDTMQK